ncbi:hypothetical protein N7539_006077 [Penicillium diatomitis]|uniref:Uncharacterized protein n=1 Tax=Penicillium diatomitis TaxID=2819901 RepID=A0A9X0BTR4_9EURO|nr:uncharacterized protein N7539_006077 [Penicillium diatomitis]KAJ5483877.1 hypothetical protein N7539_006077 [Penicillium diatomitis]
MPQKGKSNNAKAQSHTKHLRHLFLSLVSPSPDLPETAPATIELLPDKFEFIKYETSSHTSPHKAGNQMFMVMVTNI